MKLPIPGSVSRQHGFTLVEVLIALAIAAIGFGVVLHSMGLHLSSVANSIDRHQMLMYGSQVLEESLAKGTFGDVEFDERSVGAYDDQEGDLRVERYFYTLENDPVTADPRILQVTANIRGGRGSLRLSAYTIRIQREGME